MRSFNVYKWKENRALKVVTKDGRPVKIISIEANDFAPVVGVIDGIPRLFNAFGEICIIEKGNKKAVYKDHICNLYFSEEEIELNDFETYLFNLMSSYANAYVSEETVKYEARVLTDLLWIELRKKYVIIEEDKYMGLVNKLYELQNK